MNSKKCSQCKSVFARPTFYHGINKKRYLIDGNSWSRQRFCSKKCAGLNKKQDINVRFYSKVHKTRYCWIWSANRNQRGYGLFWSDNTMAKAHRVAWILNNGNIPKNKIICHHCDNPSCVKVSHLFVGTHKDNTADKINKNRNVIVRGEKHGNAKLTERLVALAKEMYIDKTFNMTEIANFFNVNKSTIRLCIRGKSWARVV